MAACIPLLHLCQEQNGYIDDDVIALVSYRLDLPPAHVKGVVTFYTLFNQQPGRQAPGLGVPHAALRAARRGRHARPLREEARHQGGRDHARRQGHAAHGRVPRELRHRADDAGRQGLLREPHARAASTRSSQASPARAGAEEADAQAAPTTSRRSTATPRAGRSRPTSAKSTGYQAARKVLTTMSRERGRRRGEEGEHPRPRRRRLPDGRQVELHAEAPRRRSPHYLVVNADEGEPGTHKDRTLMEQNPHACIEGCIIGCYGIGAHVAYIYVRDELHLSKARLWGAIEEAQAKGYLGKTPVRQRLRRRRLRPHRRGRVHLRRRDVAAQLARGQARRAAHQAAVPRAMRAPSAARRR